MAGVPRELLDELQAMRIENARLTGVQDELSRALKALHASDDRLRLACQAAHLGVWEWDLLSNRVLWYRGTDHASALADALSAGTPEAFLERVHAEDRATVDQAVASAVHHGRPFVIEFRVVMRDGCERWLASRGEVMRDDQGRAVRMLGVVFDDTARHRAEAALHASERRCQSLVESMKEWVWAVDHDQRVTYSNPAVEEVLGRSLSEVYGHVVADLVHPDDVALVDRVLADAVLHHRGWSGLRVRCRHASGQYRLLEWHGVPVFDAQGQLLGFRGYDRDVTEHQLAAQVVRRADRAESIAGLVGGVAHHFNNLLCVILANAHMLEMAKDIASSSLRDIIAASEQGAHLVRQLLLIAGHPHQISQRIDAAAHLRLLVDRLRPHRPERVTLRTHVEAAECFVDIAGVDFDAVVTHLVANAVEAMPTSGTLTISLRPVQGDPQLGTGDPVSGGWVELVVCDTGHGMTKDVARRACEPFFSTKPLGTVVVGLGLPVCQGLVDRAGGVLAMESQPGVGTEVRVLLPKADANAKPSAAPGPSRARNLSVLVCTHALGLKQNVSHILRDAGCLVLDAPTPQIALEVARQWKGRLDVVVVDDTMHHDHSLAFESLLHLEHPHIRTVVLMQGPDPAGHRDEAVTPPDPSHVAVPFTPSALLQCVQGAAALSDV